MMNQWANYGNVFNHWGVTRWLLKPQKLLRYDFEKMFLAHEIGYIVGSKISYDNQPILFNRPIDDYNIFGYIWIIGYDFITFIHTYSI
jgi:hypothetical protein